MDQYVCCDCGFAQAFHEILVSEEKNYIIPSSRIMIAGNDDPQNMYIMYIYIYESVYLFIYLFMYLFIYLYRGVV